MNVTTLILAILNSGDKTGYDIKKLSSEGPFSHFVDISYGSIYPTLAKLETEGLVTCRSESQPGKPDRKVYSISPKGRAEFTGSLLQAPQPDKFKSEFLLLAMNAGLSNREILEEAIAQRTEFFKSKIAMINEFLADCDDPATCWVGQYGLHCMKNDLKYLTENKDTLLALATAGSQTAIAAAAE